MKRKVPYAERAKEIAAIIKCVDTDDRGLLFLEIASNLRANSQHFTASLFKKMADRYGYPDPAP